MDAQEGCGKRRYTGRDDAEKYAIQLALKERGDKFHAYRCDACPPVAGERPWHVGRPRKSGGQRTVWVDETGALQRPRGD